MIRKHLTKFEFLKFLIFYWNDEHFPVTSGNCSPCTLSDLLERMYPHGKLSWLEKVKKVKMILPFLRSKIGFILLIISSVLLLLSIVLIVFIIPGIIKNEIFKNVQLREGTEQYERFLKLPFPVSFKVYFFNVENTLEILNGTKPVVKEVGPFVYKEYREKTVYNTDSKEDTISFRQQERFEFDQEASGNLTEDDFITILNAPLLSVLQSAEKFGQANILAPCLQYIFGDINSIFIRAKVKDILFDGLNFCFRGFSICELQKTIACQIAATKKNIDKSEDGSLRFSFFNYKVRSDDGFYTIKSGVKDPHYLGQIIRLNNLTHTNVWNRLGPNSTCDEIKGTDSTLYPPQVTKDSVFQIYSTDICRYVEIEFLKEETYKDIKGYLFAANNSTLRSRTESKGNDCFCAEQTSGINGEDTCFLDGVIDMQPCTGAPVLLSFPHFLWADQTYVNGVEGLTPNEENHSTFLLVEPETGTPLQGMERIQINAVLRPIGHVTTTKNFPRVVLPILWIEEGVSLTDVYIVELNEMFFDKVTTANIVKWILLGGSLTLTIIVGTYLICNRC